jgi:glycosyltransferase involved in cell wall biosynthesis
MTNSANPLISVIIPTRERAETLFFAIQTALDQTNEHYEVIVSDNFSQDKTEEVIRRFNDPRLRYFNTGQRLSMCDNWEFALEKARGKYIVFIGDDDAVLPDGINRLETLVREQESEVYMWGPSIYMWPIDNRKAAIEYLQPVQSTHEMNLPRMASRVVANGGWQYYRIPGTYHAAVSMKILELIRRKTGRVFHTTQPDVFTCMAVPVFAKTCVYIGHAITLHGCSAKSNGAATIAKNGAAVQSKFVREYINYQIHPTLFPEVPIMANLIGDACLVAMDKFPEFYGKMRFNYEAMWAFMWRLKYISFKEVFIKRSKIRKYHSFNTAMFLFYMTMQSAMILRRQIINMLVKHKEPKLGIPNNIRDFAKLLIKMQWDRP